MVQSTLLQGIIDEISFTEGECKVFGSIGYVSQVPWLFPGTIRENILLGLDYSEVWYQRVVEACALVTDFLLLSHGDGTQVGDKGVTLSGGQKARINLAR